MLDTNLENIPDEALNAIHKLKSLASLNNWGGPDNDMSWSIHGIGPTEPLLQEIDALTLKIVANSANYNQSRDRDCRLFDVLIQPLLEGRHEINLRWSEDSNGISVSGNQVPSVIFMMATVHDCINLQRRVLQEKYEALIATRDESDLTPPFKSPSEQDLLLDFLNTTGAHIIATS